MGDTSSGAEVRYTEPHVHTPSNEVLQCDPFRSHTQRATHTTHTARTAHAARAALLTLALALTACTTKDRAANGDTLAANATRDSLARRESVAPRGDSAAVATHDSTGPNASHNGWSDAQIVAYTTAVNEGEIAEGKPAGQKGTNASVKAFGRQMVSDHQTMLTEGRSFAKQHSITPDTTKDDVTGVMKDGRDHLKDLGDKKAGADWDRSYLDGEIDGHEHVLARLEDAAENTTNAPLRQMLVKATGKVQEHLTKARALKENYPKS